MKIIKQLAIVLSICLAGDALVALFSLPFSGSILGMVILFVLLCLKVVKPSDIEEVANFLLGNMMLLFIPISVGFMTTVTHLQGSLLSFLTICIIGTIVVLLLTGHTVQLVQKISRKIKGAK